MPSRKYYLKNKTDPTIQAYLRYQVSMAILLGGNEETALDEVMDAFEFESKLAKVMSHFRIQITK